MTKLKRIWLDVTLGTLFIFGLMGTIFGVSQFGIFDAFDPIGDALGDMEMTDLVFSQLRDDPPIDTNIVVVNIGELSREGIGYQIEIISRYEPKVMGFDFDLFGEPNAKGDSVLAASISAFEPIVMASELMQTDSLFSASPGIDLYDSMAVSPGYITPGVHFGFANLETEADNQEDFKACRAFPPTRNVNGTDYNAFAVDISKFYNEEKTNNFLKRKNDWEIINYRGNLADIFGRTNYPTSYQALDWDQVLREDFTPELIKGKIVLFGYLGRNLLDTSWDDKFFTPLNKDYVGKTNPDMYGVVIHANIISMILNEDYVDTFGDWGGIVLAFLVCFLNVWLFSWIYRRLPRWYDGITKLIQVFEFMILVAIMIFAFHWYNFKLNLTITLAAVALAGDGLEVYYGVIKNLFRKESRRQLFTIQRE